MTDNILISSIVVTDNINNIKQTIDSILNQSYKNLEIVLVVNYKSSDLAIKLAKKDKRIKVITLKYDYNLLSFFLEGINKASGDFIVLESCLNISSKTRFEKQLNYLAENSIKNIIGCLVKSLCSSTFCKDIETSHNRFVTRKQIDSAVLVGYLPLFLNTLMIRKSVLDNFKNIDNNVQSLDETDIILNLLRYEPIEKIGEPLCGFNQSFLYNYNSEEDYYYMLTNKIHLFNKNKYLQYRDYLNELNSSKPLKVNYTNNKNVLIIMDKLNLGGTETYLLRMCKSLNNLGFNFYIATSGGILSSLFIKNGFKLINLNLNFDKATNTFSDANYDAFKKILDDFNIKLVHCHLEKEMIFCKNACEKFNVPYVITLHGMFYSKETLSYACPNASAVIAVSEPIKLICQELGIKVTLIYNGVNTTTETNDNTLIHKKLSIPLNGKVITYCSRLDYTKSKAAENFLNSVAALSYKYSDIYAIVIGEGNRKSIIENYSKNINESMKRNIVHVLGAIYNVDFYYSESTLVVGTGRVAIEAMGCSKPILALGSKGYAGLVNENSCENILKGYFGDHSLYPPKNNFDLTEDMDYLLTHDKERQAIGDWSRSWCIANFNEIDMSRRIAEIYDKFIF